MSKVQNPIIGRTKGSAGGMTFTTSLRQNVMKAKAFTVANPNTANQQGVRLAFQRASSLSSKLTTILKKYGIANEASRRKIYPANLVTRAMRDSTEVNFTGAAFGEISMAFGENKEVGIVPTAIKLTATGKLRVEWSNAERSQKGLPAVKCCIVLKKEDSDEGEAIEPTETTEDEYYESLDAQPQIIAGAKYHVWTCAYNEATKKASLFRDGGNATLTVAQL